jgi:hypothetical protein
MSAALLPNEDLEIWVGEEPTVVRYLCGHAVYENAPADGKPIVRRVDWAPYRCPACQRARQAELIEMVRLQRGGV